MKEIQPSWVGRLLAGRYQVESLLRHGEISSIYHAIDKRVLINIIHPYLSQQPKFCAHFQQQLSAIVRLRHAMTRFISHTIREGENLNEIAMRYGVQMTDILYANGRKIKNPNLIRRGQIVIIPQYE